MGLKVLQLGLEREGTWDDHKKSKGLFGRFLLKIAEVLISKLAYIPHHYFEKEDVDEDVVREMMKHPELLDAVMKWIEEIDYSQLPKLREAKKVFEAIQKPRTRELLYRGFKMANGQQQLGLSKEGLATLSPGDEFKFVPTNLMSFTFQKAVTTPYGNVVVSVNYAKEKNRMFHITNEIMMACFMHVDKLTEFEDSYRVFSYAESVFLPDSKPLTFTLLQK